MRCIRWRMCSQWAFVNVEMPCWVVGPVGLCVMMAFCGDQIVEVPVVSPDELCEPF